jgi:hypothetical protein
MSQPIVANLHNTQTGPNPEDRRFTLNLVFLLEAKDIETAKAESLRYIAQIQDHVPDDFWAWPEVINIIEKGRFVHNLRK